MCDDCRYVVLFCINIHVLTWLSMKCVSSHLRCIGNVYALPIFNHMGLNSTVPMVCNCTTLTEEELSSSYFNCNLFSFLSGKLSLACWGVCMFFLRHYCFLIMFMICLAMSRCVLQFLLCCAESPLFCEYTSCSVMEFLVFMMLLSHTILISSF